jgi:hypothetical protein
MLIQEVMYPAELSAICSKSRAVYSVLRTSKVGWAKISGIRNRKSLEDTPRQTLDDTTDEKHLETRGKEWDADRADHDHHASNHCLLVSNPLGDVSVDDETEDASDL